MSLIRSGGIRAKVATLDSFSAAGEMGKAFARTIPITLAAGEVNSIKLQKNSNLAVRFVRGSGLFIEAVSGTVSGTILSLSEFVSTNGIVDSDFIGSIEVYSGAAVGNIAIGALNELSDSFYPDGQFVVEITNPTSETINTFLSIGVEQISVSGAYTILEPGTLLQPTTEMSDYNGVN